MRINGRSRQELLQALVEMTAPTEQVVQQLSHFGWDSDEELITLEPAHLRAVLVGYLDGALSAGTVEAWANALESREDIRLSSEETDAVAEVLFELANPEIQGQLTRPRAEQLLGRLGAPRPK